MHIRIMRIYMILDPDACVYDEHMYDACIYDHRYLILVHVCVMHISLIPENEKPAYLPKMSSARSCVSVAQWLATLPFHFT